MKTTTSDIFMKALMNGILGWLIFALFICLKHADVGIAQALITPMSIYVGIASAVGSCIGYMIRENRQNG